jgi:hypothetical protein
VSRARPARSRANVLAAVRDDCGDRAKRRAVATLTTVTHTHRGCPNGTGSMIATAPLAKPPPSGAIKLQSRLDGLAMGARQVIIRWRCGIGQESEGGPVAGSAE